MKGNIPTLADAEWLHRPAVQQIFAALEEERDEARIVGGAVRNALLGKPVGDLDFATTALPDAVMRRARAAGLKAVPTGIDHGTVTIVAGHIGYEVTTLREDVETDGRHAVVRFGRDWIADARRRDFTVNALSVDRRGVVHDPVGGYPDIVARHIRFIGDADRRIAEDRLRILRLFRLHAEHGRGELDRDALAAAIRAREGLRDLSAERIGQEMRRLVVAPGAAETLVAMQETGILPLVLGGVGYIATLSRVIAFERAMDVAPAMPPHLAALGCKVEEDVERLTARLRLSNAERDRMLQALAASRALTPRPDGRGGRGALYRLGGEAFRDGIALALAFDAASPVDPAWGELYRLPDRWSVPSFPLGGRDVADAGVARGPTLGRLLRALENWWIERDFAPDLAALRARLQQMIAAEQ
jgi:tRNA nucleotidyltransferase/poly(A) polymerase